ncbi:hypothetical protein O181_027710 [Austropuccinia psidii MF-1]|uniref:L-ornithine N(5)-oxygenase n=1 Tax=Austropuccinia psidii MF-1 TaxID=1389203 RepID=A0A9Q3CRH9_9BASI|nr:hypothetical protein [Austropuccinia psidii MF-1]
MQSIDHVNVSDTIETIESEDFFDVLIIGGGPHALGVAARLREPRPAALYTDIEHSRLSFLQRPGSVKLPRQPKRPYQLRAPVPISCNDRARENGESFPKILALDASSSNWLGRWDGFFEQLDISHLRSPMFFHPSPADVDGLEAFAKKLDRENECIESGGVEDVLPTVGQSQRGGDKLRKRATRKKGSTKSSLGAQINERERTSYARPSSRIFREFCAAELIERYHLDSVIHQDTVMELSFGDLHIKTEGLGRGFTVKTKLGRKYGAKFVVMSIGGQECPAIPQCISAYQAAHGQTDSFHQGLGWCHSRCFSYGGTKEFKEAVKSCKLNPDLSIVVIGGGLTSAQIADLAIRKGASKVVLICRGYLKTKHYDFPLSWVTKYSNLEKMSFWQEDCREARLKMVKQARNGGSVNPSTLALLKRRVAEGALTLHTHSSVTQATRDNDTGRWRLQLTYHPPNAKESNIKILENVLFIVASTGGKLDFASVPFLAPLLKPAKQDESGLSSHPKLSEKIQSVQVPGIIGGLPVLSEDLQWGTELPLFVTGAYASLEIGPDAANLSGTRAGSERVVSKLNQLLQDEWFQEYHHQPHVSHRQKATSQVSNVTSALQLLNTSENDKIVQSDSAPHKELCASRRCGFKMGARERRAGNVGGWFDGLEEVVV